MKRYLLPSLLTLSALLVGWTVVVTNFYAVPLDSATFSAPTNNQVPVYSSASKSWKAATAPPGGTNVQSGGVDITGTPATKLNFTNGLTAGAVFAGVTAIQPDYGQVVGKVPAGNDTRFNAAPAAAGDLSVDTGAAWHSIAAGASNTLLHGNGAADPTWSKLVDADITASTITAGSMASSVTNRLMLTPATIGRIEVDGGAGNPPVALAQGTSVQFLQSGGAAANPGFVSFSGDFTVAAGGLATLASTISAAGPIGDGTHVAQITFDAKGRLTAVTSVAITASGSTIALQNGGSGVTGSPASTLNATNGLTFGTVSAGVSALAPTYGVLTNTFEQGNDVRNNAAPSAAGALSVDTGSAWHSIAAGASNTLLHGNGAADPTYSSVGTNDLAASAVTAPKASTGTGSTNLAIGNDTRFNAAPSAAGKLSVDTGSAWHSLAAGAANTLLHGAGAADPTYSAVVAGDVDSTVTISAGTNAKTGDQAYGNHAITNLKAFTLTDQSANAGSAGVVQRNGGNYTYHDGTRACRIPRVIFPSAGVTNANIGSPVANQQSLTSFGSIVTLVANDLTADSSLEVVADGVQTMANTGGQTIEFDAQIGGTTVISWLASTPQGRDQALTNQPWSMRFNLFVRTAGLSGTVLTRGSIMGGAMATTTGGAAAFSASAFAFISGPAAVVTLPGSGALTIRYRTSISDGTATATLNNVRVTAY